MNLNTKPTEDKHATLILFSTSQKLTRTNLKKIFRVKKGKLFQIKRKHMAEGDLFDTLNAVRFAKSEEGQYFNFDNMNPITHIYVVKQHSCTKDFALLKYGAELVGGFDVCPSQLHELAELLEAYRQVASLCGHGRHSLRGLYERSILISNTQPTKTCKFTDSLLSAVESFDDFANPIITLAKSKVDDWYESHIWQDVYSSHESKNDKLNQLAA